MKLSLPNSPAKLTAIALFCGVMSAGTFLVASPLIHFSHGLSRMIAILALLGLFVAGFYVALTAESTLQNGTAAERWTASQLAPIRKVFGSRYIIAVAVGLIAVGVILTLMNSRQTGVIWPFILLSQSLTRIFSALKEPRPSTPLPDWRNFTPIHSDQWGQR